uniref:non-specific serine/threonine protein kinase n=1 Tax=Ananas comosus var. bracteatus TaxID=296719 RepID=A0A6V7NKT9_ANACO|nr:unnamed protein product [Ananas comosus var. bracteatus]
MASATASISATSIVPRDLKAVQIAAVRHLEPSISTSTASNAPSRRRWAAARPLRAVEPGRRGEAVAAPAAAAAGAVVEGEKRREEVDEVVDYEKLAAELENASPLEIIDKALERFGNDIAIAFRPTGSFDEVEKHYGIHIEYMFPDAVEVQALVRSKGLFSFYEDGHQECCRVRKVRPLRRALSGLKAWITGQRKDQSPGTRAHIPVVQQKNNPCFSLPPFIPPFSSSFSSFPSKHISLYQLILSLWAISLWKPNSDLQRRQLRVGFLLPIHLRQQLLHRHLRCPHIRYFISRTKNLRSRHLVLLNGSKSPIWSSSSTPSNSNATTAVLLDSSNLILTNSVNSSIIWQSFDHPADTWMPGGWLGFNKITGSIKASLVGKTPKTPPVVLFLTAWTQMDQTN